ncbi:MAG TPA: hypothetical protein VKD90_00245 [Gemmataceae bacterium]|nr:hypothetical protein [Gemmataceae bacterium]
MKIIVGGVISLTPFSPGFVWDWLHIAVGLERLGHEVYYVEEVEPKWCVDARGAPCLFENSVNRELFRTSMERFGLWERACQVYDRGAATFGMLRAELTGRAREADLLVNISGHVKADFLLGAVRRRAYIDQDPVYTQLWVAEYGKDLNFKAHDVFFSVGLGIGTPDCPIPDCGVSWHPLLPPVVVDYWPYAVNPDCRRFTTIASWAGYSDLCYRGEWYGAKAEEFKRFAVLPAKVNQEFEVVMRRHPRDEEGVRLLGDAGWDVTDADQITDLTRYQEYIARSRAEIGVAKNAYVKGRSGWFSDRASHYLASGKPVLAQATGFERHVPTGHGLLAFRTPDEAAAGVEEINRDYVGHCRAARAFAEDHLNYTKVLPRMLALATGYG